VSDIGIVFSSLRYKPIRDDYILLHKQQISEEGRDAAPPAVGTTAHAPRVEIAHPLLGWMTKR